MIATFLGGMVIPESFRVEMWWVDGLVETPRWGKCCVLAAFLLLFFFYKRFWITSFSVLCSIRYNFEIIDIKLRLSESVHSHASRIEYFFPHSEVDCSQVQQSRTGRWAPPEEFEKQDPFQNVTSGKWITPLSVQSSASVHKPDPLENAKPLWPPLMLCWSPRSIQYMCMDFVAKRRRLECISPKVNINQKIWLPPEYNHSMQIFHGPELPGNILSA